MNKKLVMLMILDGFGINDKEEGNAIKLAKTPNIDKLLLKYPHSTLRTSGLDVGLPRGQMGNSEVGHTNIGAGRIVYQDLTRITKSIEDESFFDKEEFLEAIDNCKKHNSSLHLMGLLSDGGVHSHITHLYALLELAKRHGLRNVYVHAFLDGRDTPQASAKKYVDELNAVIEEKGIGKLATIMGRFYAMDRDKRWERLKEAYDALVNGIGKKYTNPTEALDDSYRDGVYDEFVKPVVICENGTIKDEDSVIFFNFRPDRARELTRALMDKEFNEFETKKMNLCFVCMSPYDETIKNVSIAFKKEELKNTFGEYISKMGLSQLRIAETEKYAHVTFFFNGGEEKQYEGEDRILVPSPKVETYDLKPEMSAYEVTDKVIAAIETKKYDSIILNYANTDMVGHTGVFDAAIKAVEVIDECVGKVVSEIEKASGVLLITADHGNIEEMIDYETRNPHTAHTTNPVPFILVGMGDVKLNDGILKDLAPTMLDIMGLVKPKEMTGISLIQK